MEAGKDYIGIGVGALLFNDNGEVFLSKRGEKAKNEKGFWEFPGGQVDFYEKMADAVKREFLEEYGIEIEIIELLSVFDHILKNEKQHWISAIFTAVIKSGIPEIREPEKCSAIGWFDLSNLPVPLSMISKDSADYYLSKYGLNPPIGIKKRRTR